ncbi:WD repeat-containing protein, partial [Halocaridina rubra]
MASGVNPVWREWATLTSLIEQLPQHFQQGVGTSALEITCLACLPKHLVLGTNVGLVYLAHLPTLNLLRLKCENPLTPISHLSTLSTVDDMIAAGSEDGTVSIFQLPHIPDFQADTYK